MKKKLLSLTMAMSIMATMGTSVFASDDVVVETNNVTGVFIVNVINGDEIKYKVFDNPSGRARIVNGERLEIVEPPILTNDLDCLDLFKDFTSVIFLVKKDTDSGLAIVNLDKDSDYFDSLVEIFDGCYFSPIDYEIHPNGAGYYGYVTTQYGQIEDYYKEFVFDFTLEVPFRTRNFQFLFR